jgi:hypothetical protein
MVMATITASLNPVGIWSPSVGATTTISWDTEAAFTGKVYVSVNGAAETQLPGQAAAGARTGSLPLKVNIPNSYRVALRRVDNNVERANVLVTTYDLRTQVIDGFLKATPAQLRPQAITHVTVKPGVDTVRVSFRTIRPTIPLTTIFDATGTKVDARFPLFGGMRTRHEAVFGVERPLAQETKHAIRIVAAGPTGNKNSPKEAVVNREFITGVRRTEIFFDSVNVHDDGDPGGAGEFMFDFGAGDADTGFSMGEPWPTFGWTDISQYDPPVNLKQKITIPQGPARLWVQAVASEDDRTIWTGGIGLGRRPTFTEPGHTYKAVAAMEQASATEVLDIGHTPGQRETSFELRTGDYPVDFVMSCRLAVDVKLGANIRSFRLQTPLAETATVLSEAGSIAGLVAQGASERTEVVALGADGALHHRSVAREVPAQRDDGDWTRIELPGSGKISVVASGPDMLDLVFLDQDGRVSHRSYNPRKPGNAKWRPLGGKFREIVAASNPSRKAEGAVVFGVAEDGGLHVREVNGRGQDWQRLGDQALRAIIPVSIPRLGVALFAAGDDRTLHYFVKRDRRWISRTSSIPIPGRVPTQLLTAAFLDQEGGKSRQRGQAGLVIGAMSEDHHVRILRWPDFPGGSPKKGWEELGPLQELLAPGDESRPARSKRKESRGSPKQKRVSRRSAPRKAARAKGHKR